MKNRDIKLPKKYAFGLVVFYIFIFLGIIGIAFYIYTDLYTVYLIQKEITIDTGNQYQIELLPKNSKYFNYENYVYEIEDPSIVKVNKLGELTALKEGNTKVNVRFKNSFEKETLDVNVKNIEVTTLEVEKEFSLEKNSSKRLSIKVNNKDNISTNLVFLSEDTSIATVDNYGNVTGKNEGTTIITIKSSNGIEKKVNVEVTFSKEKIQEIRIKENNITLNKNKNIQLNLIIVPGSANTNNLVWNSSNPEVAIVDNYGKVTTKKEGYTVVSVTTPEGLNAQTIINVIDESISPTEEKEIIVSSVTLNTTNSTVFVGDDLKLKAVVTPNDATNKKMTWTSSNESVATVDQNGNVKGISAGTAIITVKTDNGKIATATLIVKNNDVDVTSIKIDGNVSSMYVGDSITLSATITPSNATNKKVTWKSSDTSVAIVDANGKITALKSGSVKITVTSNSNKSVSATKSIVVNVKTVPVSSLTSSVSSYTLEHGESYSWKVTVNPSNATNKQIIYSSSDSTIATVDLNGKITAKDKSGTVVITAKSKEDNSISTTIKITVKAKQLNVQSGVQLKTFGNKRYYIIIPEGATENMPLIVYFPGGNPSEPFKNYQKSIAEKTPTIAVLNGSAYNYQKFIYAFVEYSVNSTNSFKATKDMIDQIVEDYKIDKNKIIITGVSNGATLTYWMGYTYPGYYSAVVPFCGPAYDYNAPNGKGGYFVFMKDYLNYADAYVNTSLWAITAGANDLGSYEKKAKTLINKIHAIDPNAKALYASKIPEFKSVIKSELGKDVSVEPKISKYQHCTVNEYYNVPELWEWMLRQ